jgi:D-alanyl-D-alanine carboxypeptidase/D-alanyl-D-alanine-endopeptidase (penicillin-binding protein 4)
MSKFEILNIQYSMKKLILAARCLLVRRSFSVGGLLVMCFMMPLVNKAQAIEQKLQKAFQQFEKDTQLSHAISSLYVIDAKTGQVVFNRNSQVGLAPASTQKIITGVTAFELLGKGFRYKTELKYDGKIQKGKLSGMMYMVCSGDPTFGSWRFKQTSRDSILRNFSEAINRAGIKSFDKEEGFFGIDNRKFERPNIPDGWIWQDLGNYYGAGCDCMNWRENQYDLILRSGKDIGDPVKVDFGPPGEPHLEYIGMESDVVSAAKGTGDNAFIYYPFYQKVFVKGTIPVNEIAFKISGAMPAPGRTFQVELFKEAQKFKIEAPFDEFDPRQINNENTPQVLYTHFSPTLDSIIYWFNKRSVNLYGEALVKTFAYEKKGFASTDSGIAIVRDFWKQKGMDEEEINIVDGSGLSPLNRVTTHAQVEILKYAKTRAWFSNFYNSLPEFNGMKIKSGTIRGVKGFCGYHKARNGKEYIFSFLVNNYNGSSSTLVNKMYKVLDVLK